MLLVDLDRELAHVIEHIATKLYETRIISAFTIPRVIMATDKPCVLVDPVSYDNRIVLRIVRRAYIDTYPRLISFTLTCREYAHKLLSRISKVVAETYFRDNMIRAVNEALKVDYYGLVKKEVDEAIKLVESFLDEYPETVRIKPGRIIRFTSFYPFYGRRVKKIVMLVNDVTGKRIYLTIDGKMFKLVISSKHFGVYASIAKDNTYVDISGLFDARSAVMLPIHVSSYMFGLYNAVRTVYEKVAGW